LHFLCAESFFGRPHALVARAELRIQSVCLG
jgi:hypothetical protein